MKTVTMYNLLGGFVAAALMATTGYTLRTVINLDKSVAVIEFRFEQTVNDRWRRSDALLLNAEISGEITALSQRIRILENRSDN